MVWSGSSIVWTTSCSCFQIMPVAEKTFYSRFCALFNDRVVGYEVEVKIARDGAVDDDKQ